MSFFICDLYFLIVVLDILLVVDGVSFGVWEMGFFFFVIYIYIVIIIENLFILVVRICKKKKLLKLMRIL